MSEEIWKDIKGYEGLYQVSNLGRIKSLERRCKARWYTRKVPEKIYSPALDTYGYPIVSLHKDGKKKTITIHILVANAFLKKPDGCNSINHIDENKQNNCVENLEWCTVQENNAYGTRVERLRKTQQRAVLQCDLDGNVIREWEGMNFLCRETGYDQGLISKVCNNVYRHRTAYGFKWKFK